MKTWLPKLTFGAGELTPTMARRADTQQHADGVALARNVRLLNAGGFSWRPGSRHLGTLATGSRLIPFTFSVDQEYLLVLSAGRMDAWRVTGGAVSAAGSLTGCPWSAEDVPVLTWVQAGDTVFLVCRSFAPQVMQRTGASSWRIAAWTADAGPGGSLRQPYYKFADPTVTLRPSARGGTVTLTASAPVFVAAHAGLRLRYVGREIAITAVSSATVATGTVLQELPRTQRLVLQDMVGWLTGQEVAGDETGARGEITAVNAGSIDVLLLGKSASFSDQERVTGPQSGSDIDSISDLSPAATKDWEEPYLSPVYGYPGAVGLHRDRLWLGGHTSLPAHVLASRVGLYFDFDLGDGKDAEAIFESVGDAAVAWVRHFASAENLLVLTDQGPYYVPETVASPIRPSSVQFARVGAQGVGGPPPLAFDDGVLYAHRAGNAVMKVRPTGSSTRLWEAEDIGLLAPHLLRSPVAMAATQGSDGAPERYAYAVNGDGTLAVLHAIQSQQVLGWTLWTTAGWYRSVAVLGGRVFAAVERVFASGAATVCLEVFAEDLSLDGVVDVASADATAPLYAGMAVAARAGTVVFDEATVGDDGRLFGVEWDGIASFEVGRDFPVLVRTFTPQPPNQPAAVGRVKRITRARVWVHEGTRVSLNGDAMQSYRMDEDTGAAPPLRTGWFEVALRGRAAEPALEIGRASPVPGTVLAVSMEVSF